MMDNITQTENGYQVTIGGQAMSVPNDPANEDYQRVQKAIAGGMKLTVPPGPDAEKLRKVMTLSFAQLLIGLVKMSWITEAEGEAWLSGNALPAEVLTMIAGLPADMQFPAKARALRMTNAVRMDPLVLALAGVRRISPEDMDTFFTTFAEV